MPARPKAKAAPKRKRSAATQLPATPAEFPTSNSAGDWYCPLSTRSLTPESCYCLL